MVVLLGDTRRSVTSWCRRNTIGGDSAVAAVRHPEQADRGPLSRAQELELIDLLRGTHPDECGFGEELWSRESVAALIRRRFDLAIQPGDVGGYLLAWGLGPREPTDRACGLCVDAVARWMRDDYPTIVASARERHEEVCWIGRTRLHGLTPAADIIAAESIRGRTQFMVTTAAPDTRLPRDFLIRLSGAAGRTVHVVVDNSWAKVDWPRRLPTHLILHPLPSCGR
ncbi:winged helix-turn-helix domain-containing protein [Solwaraspora sp. WMMD1047]|uniref:winged helix-turn-helix domain-containing protein n=1 Tax=Solwaraspora sp. WMMD1047 TaxID=3016102 RepID=UPI0024160B87|nr:winged helix-turn-helix domain-containing protein [Solwaraspora sp. WMMD1047]MDG4828771.1 winged helix-turn-helix domain-containing protein [Solwaraspora sp. WMMD1047]